MGNPVLLWIRLSSTAEPIEARCDGRRYFERGDRAACLALVKIFLVYRHFVGYVRYTHDLVGSRSPEGVQGSAFHFYCENTYRPCAIESGLSFPKGLYR